MLGSTAVLRGFGVAEGDWRGKWGDGFVHTVANKKILLVLGQIPVPQLARLSSTRTNELYELYSQWALFLLTLKITISIF